MSIRQRSPAALGAEQVNSVDVAQSVIHVHWTRFTTIVQQVAPIYILWRCALWLVGAIALWYGKGAYRFGYTLYQVGNDADHRAEFINGQLLWHSGAKGQKELLWQIFARAWVQWDSHQYAGIAYSGYNFYGHNQPNIAFFPLYPLLIRLVSYAVKYNLVTAAMLVSQFALFAGLLLLYDVVASDFSGTVARWTLVFLLVFPASVFLGAVFTESLAIAFVAGTLWGVRRRRWWIAGIAGFLLALTRLPGVLIAPVIAVAYLQEYRWRWQTMLRPAFLAVALPPAGLALFMLYQWWHFGTPFAFMIAQHDWPNRVSPPWVLPEMMIKYLKGSTDWPINVFQLITWAGFLVLTVLALLRLPLPYGIAMLMLLLPPYLNSWHRSFSRYALVGIPGFIVLALLLRRPWMRALFITLMIPPLIVAIVLFVNGFWVG